MDRRISLATCAAFAAVVLCNALMAQAAAPRDGAPGTTAPSKAASMKEPRDTKYDSSDTLSAIPDRIDPTGKTSTTLTDTPDPARFKEATSKGSTGPEPRPAWWQW